MLLVGSSTPQEADAKDQFFQHTIKDARDDTVITILTSLVRHHHSICHRPGVLDCVFEELLFCICLLRYADLHKKHLRT